MIERYMVYLWAFDATIFILSFIFTGSWIYFWLGAVCLLLYYISLAWQLEVRRLLEGDLLWVKWAMEE